MLFILIIDIFFLVYILKDSLLKLKDYRQCFECSEVALNEASQQMMNMTAASAKEEWVATVTQLLIGIDSSLSSDNSILKESSITSSLVRLTTNLIQVTCSLVLEKSHCVLWTFRHQYSCWLNCHLFTLIFWVTILLVQRERGTLSL